MKKYVSTILAAVCLAGAGASNASPFTSNSPTGFDVTTVGASTVGGIVVELVGSNGAKVVSQLSASSLFQGYAASNPFTVGTQTGFGNAVTGALGGGLVSASFRFTLFDGDSALGDFDYHNNTLLVNNFSISDWSAINAQNTDENGNVGVLGYSNGGFRNDVLDTGWFQNSNAVTLAALFSSIDAADALTFTVLDSDPGDNFFDFQQGLNVSIINVGQGPVVTPPDTVPEPGTLALVGLAFAGMTSLRKRMKA